MQASTFTRLRLAVLVGISAANPSFGQFVFTPFTVPGQSVSSVNVTGLNNNGDAVGTFLDLGGFHGFLRAHDGTIQVLDVPGSILTKVGGINDAGEISGVTRLLGSP